MEMIEDLVFNDEWKNIGVKLSGGADSSLVYYAVCNHYKDRPDVNIYPITLDTALKGWYSTGGAEIIRLVTKLTGKEPVLHMKWFSSDHNDPENAEPYATAQEDMIAVAIAEYDLDVIYSGLTINPPQAALLKMIEEHATEFGIDAEHAIASVMGRDDSRDTTQEKTFFQQTKPNGKKIARVRPFVNKDKKAVHAAYLAMDAMETLYPHTFSCETIPEKGTAVDFIHCRHCFFCLERFYGFGRIV